MDALYFVAGILATLAATHAYTHGPLAPRTQPMPDRKAQRRRRRRSLGMAYTSAGKGEEPLEFEIEDISVSGALLRTTGPWKVTQRQPLSLDLQLSETDRAHVEAIVVRNQKPN